jgi:hypothetical protein
MRHKSDVLSAMNKIGVSFRQSTGEDGSGVLDLPGGTSSKVTTDGKVATRAIRNDRKYSFVVQPEGVEPAWERPHRHKGLVEEYIIIHGMVVLAMEDFDDPMPLMDGGPQRIISAIV